MVTIKLLNDCPHAIPRISQIWCETLGYSWLPNTSQDYIEASFQETLNNSIPLSLVAFNENNIPVGSCSLLENDGIRPDLTPWLADLTVDPKHQSQGIGKLLIHEAKCKANALGFQKLYLFTFDIHLSDYYTKLGWKKIALDYYKNFPVVVMETSLENLP